jgi:antitoxin component of MazEF toxin-antitoxin module
MYSVRRKLNKQGGSLRVSLPKVWIDAEELREGDEVEIKFDSFKGLQLFPGKRAAK